MTGRVLLFFCILGGALGASAQSLLQGRLTDAATGRPVPYVNIGVVGKALGTVTDADGQYELWVRPGQVEPADLLRISSLGYRPVSLPWDQLPADGRWSVALEPEAIALDEVVVSRLPQYTLEEMVGYPLQDTWDLAYWKDSLALGAELAARVPVNRGMRRLNTLFFNVRENAADSVLLRINIYRPEAKDSPGQHLNTSGMGIRHMLPGGAREVVVDLEPYAIWVEDDFYLSLELLAVYGSPTIALALPASQEIGGDTYRRYASQGKWERIGAHTLGFYLQTTLYSDNPRKVRNRSVERFRARNQAPVSGFVFYGRQGLPEVRVENLNTRKETRTDARGRYRILAAAGDLLRFTRQGRPPLILRLEKPGTLTVNLRGQ
ncbi:carboxypeptidase-like regulatory domain-containing protein [Robiginitalea sp. M366]|uniref:carboxypeptidase-like regulatory domain-containing protein n=1 Tax=Robiginitalea aestuariiviva TaxID=3036903 RepID=UPI00240DE44A|nr:carboxypeptidase-like regulatory domain-containing protein [Robiginitalea aestuariiviva]MDG1573063.1 carboxypeptidase-like regulatory domain-containing protein [Robiginitalea aestuariiviva]